MNSHSIYKCLLWIDYKFNKIFKNLGFVYGAFDDYVST